MASKERQPFVDEGGPSVPDWMITFSDCMTLLLTFFVLLLSFSSFDEASLMKLDGAFRVDHEKPTIFTEGKRTDDIIEDRVETVIDRTNKGAEARTEADKDKIKNPKAHETIVETDAYDNERRFYLPVATLFMGRGAALTRHGRDQLKQIASFMKQMPCNVIIGMSESGGSSRRLERTWALKQFFTEQQGLPADQFYISAGAPGPASKKGLGSTVQIVLLADEFE